MLRDPWGTCPSIVARFPDLSVKEKNDLVRHTYFQDRGEKVTITINGGFIVKTRKKMFDVFGSVWKFGKFYKVFG